MEDAPDERVAPASAGVPPPESWGPPLWDFLFAVAFRTRTEEQTRALQQCCSLLRTTLPCPDCRASYAALYAAHPAPRTGSLFRWLWQVKDAVNHKLDKPYVSYEDARARYGVALDAAALAETRAAIPKWLGAIERARAAEAGGAATPSDDVRRLRKHAAVAGRAAFRDLAL